MTADIVRFRLLLVTLAGWISQHQQDVIDYLVEENRVLKEQLGSLLSLGFWRAFAVDVVSYPGDPPQANAS